MSDEILAAFAAESAEILDDIEEAIHALERGEEGAIDRLFRFVHTLKGSASIVGLARLESFAHAWESRLGRLRAGASCAEGSCTGLLLACRDRVARLLAEASPSIGGEEAEKGGLGEEDEALLAALDAALADASVPPEPAAPPAAHNAAPTATAPASPFGAPSGAQEGAPPSSPGGRARTAPAAARGGHGRAAPLEVSYARVANFKLEAILAQSSELVQAISELGRELKAYGDGRLLDQVQALHSSASQLYRNILETRTIPFGEVAERYRRVVADIARESGKALRFELSGADTEIDKALADRLAEPLLHLVRNAADHGVERPDLRLAAGKPREGLVALRARRDSGALVVRVEDDGRGVEPEAIRLRARELNLEAEGVDVNGLSEEGLLALLFRPGFSLSGNVTRWSGRGVGLDAVERNVRGFRGSVRLETRPGKGFAAEIKLPLALSLVEGFGGSVGATKLLVPFEAVRSCIAFLDDGRATDPFRTIAAAGRLVPAIDLGLLYGEAVPSGERVLVLVEDGGAELGLVLDEVGEAFSVAVRPIDRRFADSPGIAGVAALGDGSLVLVLDPAELVRRAHAKNLTPTSAQGFDVARGV